MVRVFYFAIMHLNLLIISTKENMVTGRDLTFPMALHAMEGKRVAHAVCFIR